VPDARTLHGHERLFRWLFGMLAAFPDAKLAIEHSIALEEPGQPVRVATRWWLTGTHTGHGQFGPPSGATVLLLGITHSNVVNGRIRDEWVVADELALRKQIALQRG
jgi:predicted ester cyclase